MKMVIRIPQVILINATTGFKTFVSTLGEQVKPKTTTIHSRSWPSHLNLRYLVDSSRNLMCKNASLNLNIIINMTDRHTHEEERKDRKNKLQTAMQSFLCNICCVVQSLLCNICCASCLVQSLLCNPCCV